MSLVRAERRRLFKRRFTRLMLVLVLIVLATIAGAFVLNSQKIGPAERAAAQVEAQRQVEQWTVQSQREREACEADQSAGRTERFPRDFDCSQIRGPQVSDVDPQWFLPYEFNFRKEFSNLLMVFGGLLALFAFIVAASYVGAEWNSGGMMNLLLWRPRRVPVLLTKLGVVLAGVTAVGLVFGGLWTLAFWMLGRYDGVTGTMTAGAWRSFALDGARGIGLALALAVIGFGLASIGRHTAMALGAAIGVIVIGEIGLRIALSLMQVEFADRYALSTYGISWFFKQYKLVDYSACDWTLGECKPKELVLTWQDSALVFGVGTAVIAALAFWVMRRRDVT